MADAKDAHGVVFESEQDTVITEAQPERSSHVAVQRIHITGASASEAENPFKQAHGGSLIHGANVGPGFIEPLDPVWRHLLVELKILGLQPELGEHCLHRNTLAALRKPSLPVVKALAVLLGYRFIVGRRGSQGAPDGIEQHELQEPNRSGDL
jgi:hypothetical protein